MLRTPESKGREWVKPGILTPVPFNTGIWRQHARGWLCSEVRGLDKNLLVLARYNCDDPDDETREVCLCCGSKDGSLVLGYMLLSDFAAVNADRTTW